MRKTILATFAFSALMTADVFAGTCPANRPSCSPETSVGVQYHDWYMVLRHQRG